MLNWIVVLLSCWEDNKIPREETSEPLSVTGETMPRKSSTKNSTSYDEAIAKMMREDSEFAGEAILSSIRHGSSINEALAGVIARMGVKAVARIVKSSQAEVASFMKDPDHAPFNLVEKYLSAFGCKLTAKALRRRKAA